MERESFDSRHPLVHMLLVAVGLTASIAFGALVIPRLADRLSACMIKKSASVDIPDEGPEIVRNDGTTGQ